MPVFGAHMSIAGGYSEALPRIVAIGGNCLQMFSASPRGWNLAKVSEEEATAFRAEKMKRKIDPVYFHASYLINLADGGFIGDHSVESLIAEFTIASKLGVRGSIIHLGSFKDKQEKIKKGELGLPGEKNPKYRTLIKNITTVLRATPEDTLFIIENAGTRKIGMTMEEIGQIIADAGNDRVRVCLDTCHLHAAGYDLRSEEKLDLFLKLFDRCVGLKRLECFHMNDSRDPFGSLRDRHENIGDGEVGKEVFRLLLTHPKTKHIPCVIETPGFDGNGPDKKNLDILKSMI